MRLEIPEIETERLLLRAFRSEDLDPYAEMMADADVVRYIGDGNTLSRFDAWRQMAMFAGHWPLNGFGIWAVEEKSSGRFAGRIGCFQPDGWPGFEIGYTLSRAMWGKGYAREGVRASLDYARKVLRKTEIISVIRPGNDRSTKVAESFGAVRGPKINFLGSEAHVYKYPEDDHSFNDTSESRA